MILRGKCIHKGMHYLFWRQLGPGRALYMYTSMAVQCRIPYVHVHVSYASLPSTDMYAHTVVCSTPDWSLVLVSHVIMKLWIWVVSSITETESLSSASVSCLHAETEDCLPACSEQFNPSEHGTTCTCMYIAEDPLLGDIRTWRTIKSYKEVSVALNY